MQTQTMQDTNMGFHCSVIYQKVITFLAVILLSTINIYAQAPNQFTFQGVARDASAKIIANASITLHVKIRESSPNGIKLFEEIHEVSTNAAGVFNAVIGSQAQLNLDWSKGPYFLNVLIDPSGGNDLSDYVDLGSTQLLSVPYALMANKLPELDPISQVGSFGNGKLLESFPAGPSLIWYPRKDSFKVGMGAISENSLGEHSTALGHFSMAPANYATALGRGTIANVNEGIVLGKHNDVPLVDLEGNQDGRLLQIGNGTSSENRSNALTMLGNGRIGIGANVLNPKYLLDIGGRIRLRHNIKSAGVYLDNSQGIENAFIGMKSDIETGFYIDEEWRFWVNKFGNGYLDGSIIQTSDRRLKRDITSLSNSLSKLTNLSGKQYFWKDSKKSPDLQTGLIAQDVEMYFPELVTTDEKGMKAINYIGLIPHLIESVKALKAREEKLAVLQKQLADHMQLQIDEQKTKVSKKDLSNTAANRSKGR